MSALAQYQPYFAATPRRINEVELLRLISSITWTATYEEQAFSAIDAAIVRLPGLSGFRFEPFDSVWEKTGSQPAASALAEVSANGRAWGLVRIFFDPHVPQTLESPVRLAKFIGQQVALLLDRLYLERERMVQRARLETLHGIVRRRKIIHRAASVLARKRGSDEAEALSAMVRFARQHRRNLLQIADSILLGYDNTAFSKPSLRRLAAHDLTFDPQTQRPSL